MIRYTWDISAHTTIVDWSIATVFELQKRHEVKWWAIQMFDTPLLYTCTYILYIDNLTPLSAYDTSELNDKVPTCLSAKLMKGRNRGIYIGRRVSMRLKFG